MDIVTLALAKALGGNGGGGGSSGGVLVVNMDLQTMTLDKTWQEIHDGGFSVLYVNNAYALFITSTAQPYQVIYAMINPGNGSVGVAKFIANDADEYPVLENNNEA